MKSQTELLRWLRANLGNRATAPLTSQDTHALVASVAMCPLISYQSAPLELFQAYGAIVRQMQAHTVHLAYHAIAMELDWSHRRMIWQLAGLDAEIPTSRCAHEPQRPTKCPGCGNDQCPGCDGKFHDDSRPESHIYAENPPI